MVGRDPSDSGGLFVGRPKPKYKPLPKEGQARRYDRLLSILLILLMVLTSISIWGPLPLLALWIGSQTQYLSGSPFLGFIVTFIVILGFLLSAVLVLSRLDRFWITVRRAQGIDQQKGVFVNILVIVFALGLVSFLFWFIFISGFGPSYSF